MEPALFGISVLLSLVSAMVFATFYVWPRLRSMSREQAILLLVVPHLFLRYIGLSFLVPGVVAPSLPASFAVPAAYGDLAAGILALIAFMGLARRASWAIPAVWVFNVWGAADLLFAFYAGGRSGIVPGDLGAAFFIPATIVPPMLVTHLLIFRALVQRERRQPASIAA